MMMIMIIIMMTTVMLMMMTSMAMMIMISRQLLEMVMVMAMIVTKTIHFVFHSFPLNMHRDYLTSSLPCAIKAGARSSRECKDCAHSGDALLQHMVLFLHCNRC
jgi:hypothetical protein